VIDGEIKNDLEKYLDELVINGIITMYKLPFNRGLANALNFGINKAKYELIARMDSDDISTSNRFEIQIARMKDENLDIIGGQIIEFGKDTLDVVSKRIVPSKHDEIINYMKFRSPFSHPTVIFKKNVFFELGGYSTIQFPEDYDFFVRAHLKGFKLGNTEEFVLWFRLGFDKEKSLRRRWGIKYAKSELKLFINFYKMGFYNIWELLIFSFVRVPLRILPFRLFKFVYFTFSR